MLKLFTLRGSLLVEVGNTCADDDTDNNGLWDQALSIPLLLVGVEAGGAMGGAAGGGGAWYGINPLKLPGPSHMEPTGRLGSVPLAIGM